jgi:hypothetical protein
VVKRFDEQFLHTFLGPEAPEVHSSGFEVLDFPNGTAQVHNITELT